MVGNMSDDDLVLRREQRDEIIRAVTAIERQLKEIGSTPRWQARYVIETNLARIQANVSGMPRITLN